LFAPPWLTLFRSCIESGESFTFLLGDTKNHSSFSTTRIKTGGPTTICTKESLEFIRAKMKGCDYLVLEGGHNLHVDNVTDFVAVLDSIVQVVINGHDDGEDSDGGGA